MWSMHLAPNFDSPGKEEGHPGKHMPRCPDDAEAKVSLYPTNQQDRGHSLVVWRGWKYEEPRHGLIKTPTPILWHLRCMIFGLKKLTQNFDSKFLDRIFWHYEHKKRTQRLFKGESLPSPPGFQAQRLRSAWRMRGETSASSIRTTRFWVRKKKHTSLGNFCSGNGQMSHPKALFCFFLAAVFNPQRSRSSRNWNLFFVFQPLTHPCGQGVEPWNIVWRKPRNTIGGKSCAYGCGAV